MDQHNGTGPPDPQETPGRSELDADHYMGMAEGRITRIETDGLHYEEALPYSVRATLALAYATLGVAAALQELPRVAREDRTELDR